MIRPIISVTQEVVRAAVAFACQRTGQVPGFVDVAESEDGFVITMYDWGTVGEHPSTPSAAATLELRERYLYEFSGSSNWLRQEIRRITGSQVRAIITADVVTAGVITVQMEPGSTRRREMSSDGHNSGSSQSDAEVNPGSKPSAHTASATKGTRTPRSAGGASLEAMRTVDLVKELERREEIAMRLAINDALNPVSQSVGGTFRVI